MAIYSQRQGLAKGVQGTAPEGASETEDTAAGAGHDERVGVCLAAGDRHPGYPHCSTLDDEDAAGVVAADLQLIRPRTLDGQVCVIVSAPLVRVMVPVTLKVMVSPAAAPAIAWRKEPGPLSLRLLTERVAARALFALPRAAKARAQTAMVAMTRTRVLSLVELLI
jgi:hypothetical protein